MLSRVNRFMIAENVWHYQFETQSCFILTCVLLCFTELSIGWWSTDSTQTHHRLNTDSTQTQHRLNTARNFSSDQGNAMISQHSLNQERLNQTQTDISIPCAEEHVYHITVTCL